MTSEELIEKIADAIDATPNLWLHEVNEDEWHICHWGERVEGEKREWVVVGEASDEKTAAQRRDALIRTMRAKAAIAAIHDAKLWLAPQDLSMTEMNWIAEVLWNFGFGRAWAGLRDVYMRTPQ